MAITKIGGLLSRLFGGDKAHNRTKTLVDRQVGKLTEHNGDWRLHGKAFPGYPETVHVDFHSSETPLSEAQHRAYSYFSKNMPDIASYEKAIERYAREYNSVQPGAAKGIVPSHVSFPRKGGMVVWLGDKLDPNGIVLYAKKPGGKFHLDNYESSSIPM